MSILYILLAFVLVSAQRDGRRGFHLHSGGRRSRQGSLDRGEAFENGDLSLCRQEVDCTPEKLNGPYRTYDGSCNNKDQQRQDWGMAITPMRRMVSPAYSDGQSLPRSGTNGPLPNVRKISSEFHIPENSASHPDAEGITHIVMQWGQFLDHDITHTPVQEEQDAYGLTAPYICCRDVLSEVTAEDEALFNNQHICNAIAVPADDSYFTARTCLNFVRSIQVPNARCQNVYPAEQLNQITAFIDASNVYGSSEEEAVHLRLSLDGRLNITTENRLPYDEDDSVCTRDTDDNHCYLAGDGRVNEQMGLTTMHTIWLRTHNRIAQGLRNRHSLWQDEAVYQETRKIVGALMQQITYGEFLPIVLGNRAESLRPKPPGTGHNNIYNANTDPSILNAFATAAYRFGHSLIRDSLQQYSLDYTPGEENSLRDIFGRVWFIQSDKSVMGEWIRGMVTSPAKKMDNLLSEEVTNHLFETRNVEQSGLDLAALNIQRGRDHGLPGYKAYFDHCTSGGGGRRPNSAQIPIEQSKRDQMLSIYGGRIEDVDLFVGGLAETAVVGEGLVGPTFGCILHEQFKRLREGDRFWFEKSGPQGFTAEQLDDIRQIKLSKILCEATSTDEIQENVFRVRDDFGNRLKLCSDLKGLNLDLW